MGKIIFIPMFMTAAHSYQPVRTQRRCQQRAPKMHQPSLLDVLLSDYFGQICSKPTSKNCCRSVTEKRPWIYSVKLTGFEPEDIAVKVENGVVHITARQVQEIEEGYDIVERYRKVQLPENIDDEKLNCLMTDDGKMILNAPLLRKDPPSESEDTPISIDESSKLTSTRRPTDDSEVKVSETNKKQPDVIDIPIEHDDTVQKANGFEEVNEAASHYEILKKERQQHEIKEACDKTDERDEKNSEGHLSRQRTPQESIEFVILGDVTPNEDPQKTDEIDVQSEENTLNIQEMENEISLPFMDSTKEIETDGKREFEINVKLKDFTPENTVIRWKNDTLEIDAEREVKADSLSSFQKVHRVYTVPELGVMKEARASMNNDGMLRVTIPLKNES